MIAVTSELRAKSGREQELEGIAFELAERVRSDEPGCRDYEVARARHDSRVFLTLERYDDDEALNAHCRAEHFKEAFPRLMECVEQPPRVTVFDLLDAASGAPSG